MIDSVPLIQNPNDAQQINASIIAMKKASRELNEKIVKLNSLNSELDKKIALLDSGLAQEITDRENADSAEVTNRNNAITNAVNALDVASVGGSGKYISAISETDGKINATASDLATSVTSGNSQPVTSGGVASELDKNKYGVLASAELSSSGWYRIARLGSRSSGQTLKIKIITSYYHNASSAHNIEISYGWVNLNVIDFARDYDAIFDKIRFCYNSNDGDKMAVYVHYNKNQYNVARINIDGCVYPGTVLVDNFVSDSTTWENTKEFNLGSDGFYFNGQETFDNFKTITVTANVRGNSGTCTISAKKNISRYCLYFSFTPSVTIPKGDTIEIELDSAILKSNIWTKQTVYATNIIALFNRSTTVLALRPMLENLLANQTVTFVYDYDNVTI